MKFEAKHIFFLFFFCTTQPHTSNPAILSIQNFCNWICSLTQFLQIKDRSGITVNAMQNASEIDSGITDEIANNIIKKSILTQIYESSYDLGQDFSDTLCNGCIPNYVIASTAHAMQEQAEVVFINKSVNLMHITSQDLEILFSQLPNKVYRNLLNYYEKQNNSK